MDAKTPLIIYALLALLAGPAVGQEREPDADDATSNAKENVVSENLDQEESWTWFGMGFENRRQRRGAEGDSFGPSGRPRGGFGGSARSGRGGR